MHDGVLIVGAGPVGMVAARYLAGEGIPVTVIESAPTLPRDLRASTFHPPTLEMLEGSLPDDVSIIYKFSTVSVQSYFEKCSENTSNTKPTFNQKHQNSWPWNGNSDTDVKSICENKNARCHQLLSHDLTSYNPRA